MRLIASSLLIVLTSVGIGAANPGLALLPLFPGFPPEPRETNSEKWVTVHGQVVFGGDKIPPPNSYPASNGWPEATVPKWVVHPKNKGIKNVIVWISSDEKNRGIRMPEEKIHPDLRKVPSETIEIRIDAPELSPCNVAARAGQKFVFKNSIDKAVDFRCMGHARAENHLLMPGKSCSIEWLKEETMPVCMSSNLFRSLNGFIRVFDHPYYAVTDEDGKFEIRLVPTGKMRLFLWHPECGYRDGAKGNKGDPIDVKPRRPDLGKFVLKPTDDT
jgi:hypothetical protein